MHARLLLILVCTTCLCLAGRAQQNTDRIDQLTSFPARFFDHIHKKTASLEDRLNRQTEKYLQRLSRKEARLKRQLYKLDSTAANNLFKDSTDPYRQLANRLKQDTGTVAKDGQYLANIDSLKTSLAFLNKNSELLPNAQQAKDKVQGSLQQVNHLQSKLNQADQVKQLINERKQQIKETLSKYNKLPPGLRKSYEGYQQEAYYYAQQLREYKELLNHPDQLQQKALTVLNKLPAFQSFMQQHSELASLFRLPDNYGSAESLAGLQTRAQVQQTIQSQLSAAGPNAQQVLQQNLQAAQAQLNELKNKVAAAVNKGGSAESADLPDFKPNNQRTKTFWQRLEYGSNLQTVKSNYFFPTTTDIGASIGYKLTDKSIVGIGASYKMGWGRDIRNINITSQGAGLRSFLDVKLKGSFYASGGFEYNYQPGLPLTPSGGGGTSPPSAWQQSGLAGISKMVSMQTKFFRKTKLQLLWDFLSYQQVPRGQPVKFRVGYSF